MEIDGCTCAAWRSRGRLRVVLTVVVGLIWAASAPLSSAQFSSIDVPDQLVTSQRANLFATWEGQTDVDGLFVELPAGWVLRGARALRYGWEQVPLTVRSTSAGGTRRYVVEAPHALHGPHEFVLSVTTADESGRSEWMLEPFAYQQSEPVPLAGDAVGGQVRLRSPDAASNRVLAFAEGDGAPLVFTDTVLPELASRSGYSLGMWLRTAGLDEVVLSTWDGDEHHAYPLEMVVDAGGHLAVYRGQPGHHESLVTRRRIADGTWHHVMVTHRPEAVDGRGGWYLYLDGQAVDSLPAAPAYSSPVQGLALGARLAPAASGGQAPFTGALDDLTLLSRPLAAAAVRRHLSDPSDPGPDGLLLTFEDSIDERVVARRTSRAQRQAAVRARDEGGLRLGAYIDGADVELSWRVPPSTGSRIVDRRIVVQRSEDGTSFVPVATLTRSDAARTDADGFAHFIWTDRDVSEHVVFYRVRYIDGDDNELDAATLKVGLGDRRDQQNMLIGNFPNPFNSFTTISYELPETEQVRLGVWDLSGHQVAQLIDEVQSEGTHEVRFASDDLPSGTYFVRLQTPSRSDTHKMILMK